MELKEIVKQQIDGLSIKAPQGLQGQALTDYETNMRESIFHQFNGTYEVDTSGPVNKVVNKSDRAIIAEGEGLSALHKALQTKFGNLITGLPEQNGGSGTPKHDFSHCLSLQQLQTEMKEAGLKVGTKEFHEVYAKYRGKLPVMPEPWRK